MAYHSVYRIAEKNIGIASVYDEVHTLCADYRISEAADGGIDFSVSTTASDMIYEREKSEREDILEQRPVRHFPEPYLETLAVYRKIAEEMLHYDTFLFHGSAIAVDGKGYLFTAKSGTGKSTHTRFWREVFGERAVMVNDDKPLLRINPDKTVTVFGTPWDGKHHLSRNLAVPLRAVCILRRDSYNHIEPIPASDALPMLLQQSYRPQDIRLLKRTLELVDGLAMHVSHYRLGCLPDRNAAETAFAGMCGEKKDM